MKHFTIDQLGVLNPDDAAKYRSFFSDVIEPRLKAPFIREYAKRAGLHDWYFDDLLISNTGKGIRRYSRNRTASIQLGFFSGDRKYAMMSYVNVTSLDISCEISYDVQKFCPTAFGRYLYDRFDVADDKSLWHGILFEEGATIELRFEKVYLEPIKMGLDL